MQSSVRAEASPHPGARRIGALLLAVMTISVIVQVTQVYRIVALVGVSSTLASVVLGGVTAIILILLRRVGVGYILYKDVALATIVFLIIPTISAFISVNGFFVDLIFRTILQFVVILGSFSIFMNRDGKGSAWITICCLSITLAGALMSLVFPQLFAVMGDQVQASIGYEGRAFGFFLQPNALGIAAVAFYMVGAPAGRGLKWEPRVMFILTLACVLLSASRFATMMFALYFVLRIVLVYGGHRSLRRDLKRVFAAAFAGIAIVVPIHYISNRILAAGIFEAGSGFDRVLSLLALRAGHSADVGSINSLNLRLHAQEVYINKIMENPFFGHGFGVERTLFSSNVIEYAAHSSALSIIIQMGIPYFLLVIWCLAYPLFLWKGASDDIRREYIIFLFISCLSILFNHGMIENGLLAFAFGAMLVTLRPAATFMPSIWAGRSYA